MFYLHDALEASNSAAVNARNASADDEGVLDEDCANFASAASSKLEDDDLPEPSSPQPNDDQPPDVQLVTPAFGLPSVVDAADSTPIPLELSDNERKPPCGKSIAHFDLLDHNIVFLSLGLETGGEYCGIIQISGQLFRFDPHKIQMETN